MAGEIAPLGYQGDPGFWSQPRQDRSASYWWNTDMADAGQILQGDPKTAVTAGAIPKEMLAQADAAKADARKARGGFMASLGGLLNSADDVLSNVTGYGVAKNLVKWSFQPIDKLASGLYWAYSEGISQPLSTLIIQASKAELTPQGGSVLMSGDEWKDAYGKAEHLSPGQAWVNASNVASATGDIGPVFNPISETFSAPLTAAIKLGSADQDAATKAAVSRNTERFLYDSDFWRSKAGWRYTVGTGALDFALNMGADPSYAAVKGVSAGVKGLRSIKIAEEGAEAASKSTAIERALSKTPEEASRSQKIEEFYDWADGKSGDEIAEHPIWGRGRRANPERYSLSQVFAGAERDEMPLIFRFAAADNQAATELVNKNQNLMVDIAKLEDNRVLVDSAKFDNEFFQYVSGVQQHGTNYPIMTQVPPMPVGGTPAQLAGWQKTYGAQIEKEKLYKKVVADIGHKMGPMGPAGQTSLADILMAEQWRAGKLQEIDTNLAALQSKQDWYGDVLGSLETHPDDFSPGASNLFGTMKTAYRQGPLALRSTTAAAERNIQRLGAGKDYAQLSKAQGPVDFATRLLRNGFYSAPIRIVQSVTERLPDKFINHNDADAYQRVAEMLKQVPGLGPDRRLEMIKNYSQAGDKVARSKELETIHQQVVEHLASRYNLDPEHAKIVNDMQKLGFQKTMLSLTGQGMPKQMYSAALEEPGEAATMANRVDFMEDGEGWMISPLAKTQLQYAEPLLPVKELDRILSRSSGFLGSLKKSGGSAVDGVTAISDLMNSVWKAGTLLRPGYILRSMSEEQVASAIKFGMLSSLANAGEGGWNFLRNRNQQVHAIFGKGSYTSARGTGKGYVTITDQAGLQAAANRGFQTERINVGKEWPLIQDRIETERDHLTSLEGAIDKAVAKGDIQLADSLRNQAADHRDVLQEHMDYASAVLQEARDASGRRLGEGVIKHRGVEVPQAFSPEWPHPIPRDQITSAHAMETIFARGESIERNRMIKTGSWTAITPDQPQHMESWLNALNKQWRQDDLFQKVAEDPSLQVAKDWVKTPEGRYHMSLLGPRARDADGTIHAVKQTLDQYLPEGTGLQAKIAKGEEIYEHELRAAIAKEDFPAVHGEETKALTAAYSKQSPLRMVDDIIEKGFKLFSTIPNDIMARQPIYLRAQEARMRQLIDQEISYRTERGISGDLSLEEMNKLLDKSDRLARKDIAQVVYDPTRTTATEALRFVTPFLGAHIDGLVRWGGLIAEKPQFLTTAGKVYNAPVAAGLVTDQYGRAVSQDGTVEVEDESGKKHRQFVPLEQRTMILRNPSGEKHIKGAGNVKTGGIRIPISSLNTILPGDPWFNPGTGPYAQVALSEVAKKSPALGDFMQWAKVMPYGQSPGPGIRDEFYDAFTPAYVKDAWDTYNAIDSGTGQSYQDALLAEWQRQSGEHANGGPAPDWKKTQHNAKQFMFLDALTNWLSPARTRETPLTRTPYQFFVDQWKVMQETAPDKQTAQAQFLQKYGEDYFAFTSSMSKSVGVQATLPAQHMAEKYGDLIANDPDLAPLIVGDVYNQGKFSNSVYRKQMDQLLNGVQMRSKVTALEAIADNKKSLGWLKFNKFAATLDSALIRSGFHSYNQAGAEPFAHAKQQFVSDLAAENPSWYEDFGTTNTTRLHGRIEGMKRLVSDERIQADPIRAMDLGPLALYLQQRDILKAELAKRGSSRLSFGEDGTPEGQNADIGMNLRTLQLYLVNNSLGFGDIYHRYLENDDLS